MALGPGALWPSVEAAARQAYGRLVALLAARSGDLAGAEDALGDALVAALEHWPVTGVPSNPEAWLLTVARRRGIDNARRDTRAKGAHSELMRMQEEAGARMQETPAFPDERLALMLVCAHPAIERASHTPLMLQLVLGLTAERMAPLFLLSPAAMTKRLVRAKAKIGAAGISFRMPEPEHLRERIDPLLDAIYGAFTLASAGQGQGALGTEALWLGRLVADLAPAEPEAAGLAALMEFVAARTRSAEASSFTPLSEQDPDTWDGALMARAEARLAGAVGLRRPGRFQTEAAIQAVHADRRRTGRTDWPAILLLYEGLLAQSPTIGAIIARSAALAQAGDAAGALRALDAIDRAQVTRHQPFWATRAFALARAGQAERAAEAYARAAALAESPALRDWLLAKRAALITSV